MIVWLLNFFENAAHRNIVNPFNSSGFVNSNAIVDELQYLGVTTVGAKITQKAVLTFQKRKKPTLKLRPKLPRSVLVYFCKVGTWNL